VTLILPSRAAGSICFAELIHVNEPGWNSRVEALVAEPAMWPSEVALEFRHTNRKGEEFTLFGGQGYLSGIVGTDAQIRVERLPYGFALSDCAQLNDQNESSMELGSCLASAWDGLKVRNHNREKVAILPRPNSSVAYLLSADDILPQVILGGPLAPTQSEWGLYRVQCRRTFSNGDPYGLLIALATYRRDRNRWIWTLQSKIDLTPFLGTPVIYVVEEMGTARTAVSGKFAPSPEVELCLKKPDKPWTLRTTVLMDGELFQIPVKFTYSFGSRQFSGSTTADAAGLVTIRNIEGPSSPQELEESTYFHVEPDSDQIRTLLVDLYVQKFGSGKSEPGFETSWQPPRKVRKQFESAFIENELGFTTRVALDGSVKTLKGFLATYGLEGDFREMLRKRALER
jgi:hypothetical protein